VKSRFGIVISAAMVLALAAGCSSSSDGSSSSAGGSGASARPVDVGAPLPAEVKSRGKLAVGVKCDYPPFGYIDEASKNAGFEIDIAHQLASYAFGDPNALTLTCVTGSNRVSFLTSKRIDLIEATMNYTPERAQTIDFSTPYFASGVKLLVPKNSPITSFDELAGKQVISISGATASLWLTQCMKDVKQTLFAQTSQALTSTWRPRTPTSRLSATPRPTAPGAWASARATHRCSPGSTAPWPTCRSPTSSGANSKRPSPIPPHSSNSRSTCPARATT
jgi:polar amino acid transport system substrate-binding protein